MDTVVTVIMLLKIYTCNHDHALCEISGSYQRCSAILLKILQNTTSRMSIIPLNLISEYIHTTCTLFYMSHRLAYLREKAGTNLPASGALLQHTLVSMYTSFRSLLIMSVVFNLSRI